MLQFQQARFHHRVEVALHQASLVQLERARQVGGSGRVAEACRCPGSGGGGRRGGCAGGVAGRGGAALAWSAENPFRRLRGVRVMGAGKSGSFAASGRCAGPHRENWPAVGVPNGPALGGVGAEKGGIPTDDGRGRCCRGPGGRCAGPQRENWPEVGVPSGPRACSRWALRSCGPAGRCAAPPPGELGLAALGAHPGSTTGWYGI